MTSSVMNMHIKNGVPYMTFKILDNLNFVSSAVSTRHGGVSSDKSFSSLNLGTSTEDSWDNVLKNYHIFCSATGFDIERLVLAKQTHSSNVMVADESHAGKGVLIKRDYDNIDSLITNKKNLPLVIHTADCVPVSFTDTKNKAIGNAHCGWRGTYSLLAKETLLAMSHEYGTDAKDVVVTIGPCICKDCYEVSEDLYLDFKEKFQYEDCIIKENNKFYLDLANINKNILMNAGVKEENISLCDLCTCCNRDDLFSHRGQGGRRGILSSVISLI